MPYYIYCNTAHPLRINYRNFWLFSDGPHYIISIYGKTCHIICFAVFWLISLFEWDTYHKEATKALSSIHYLSSATPLSFLLPAIRIFSLYSIINSSKMGHILRFSAWARHLIFLSFSRPTVWNKSKYNIWAKWN